uniref:Mucin-17-like n=1 Tax=Saccoglossus kowalevskii TaxID=10224 RepID=A0ABM0MED8_SACKO|nr:PREDICTED: mucin-17-like [Saccoglossus kowalevskii]
MASTTETRRNENSSECTAKEEFKGGTILNTKSLEDLPSEPSCVFTTQASASKQLCSEFVNKTSVVPVSANQTLESKQAGDITPLPANHMSKIMLSGDIVSSTANQITGTTLFGDVDQSAANQIVKDCASIEHIPSDDNASLQQNLQNLQPIQASDVILKGDIALTSANQITETIQTGYTLKSSTNQSQIMHDTVMSATRRDDNSGASEFQNLQPTALCNQNSNIYRQSTNQIPDSDVIHSSANHVFQTEMLIDGAANHVLDKVKSYDEPSSSSQPHRIQNIPAELENQLPLQHQPLCATGCDSQTGEEQSFTQCPTNYVQQPLPQTNFTSTVYKSPITINQQHMPVQNMSVSNGTVTSLTKTQCVAVPSHSAPVTASGFTPAISSAHSPQLPSLPQSFTADIALQSQPVPVTDSQSLNRNTMSNSSVATSSIRSEYAGYPPQQSLPIYMNQPGATSMMNYNTSPSNCLPQPTSNQLNTTPATNDVSYNTAQQMQAQSLDFQSLAMQAYMYQYWVNQGAIPPLANQMQYPLGELTNQNSQVPVSFSQSSTIGKQTDMTSLTGTIQNQLPSMHQMYVASPDDLQVQPGAQSSANQIKYQQNLLSSSNDAPSNEMKQGNMPPMSNQMLQPQKIPGQQSSSQVIGAKNSYPLSEPTLQSSRTGDSKTTPISSISNSQGCNNPNQAGESVAGHLRVRNASECIKSSQNPPLSRSEAWSNKQPLDVHNQMTCNQAYPVQQNHVSSSGYIGTQNAYSMSYQQQQTGGPHSIGQNVQFRSVAPQEKLQDFQNSRSYPWCKDNLSSGLIQHPGSMGCGPDTGLLTDYTSLPNIPQSDQSANTNTGCIFYELKSNRPHALYQVSTCASSEQQFENRHVYSRIRQPTLSQSLKDIMNYADNQQTEIKMNRSSKPPLSTRYQPGVRTTSANQKSMLPIIKQDSSQSARPFKVSMGTDRSCINQQPPLNGTSPINVALRAQTQSTDVPTSSSVYTPNLMKNQEFNNGPAANRASGPYHVTGVTPEYSTNHVPVTSQAPRVNPPFSPKSSNNVAVSKISTQAPGSRPLLQHSTLPTRPVSNAVPIVNSGTLQHSSQIQPGGSLPVLSDVGASGSAKCQQTTHLPFSMSSNFLPTCPVSLDPSKKLSTTNPKLSNAFPLSSGTSPVSAELSTNYPLTSQLKLQPNVPVPPLPAGDDELLFSLLEDPEYMSLLVEFISITAKQPLDNMKTTSPKSLSKPVMNDSTREAKPSALKSIPARSQKKTTAVVTGRSREPVGRPLSTRTTAVSHPITLATATTIPSIAGAVESVSNAEQTVSSAALTTTTASEFSTSLSPVIHGASVETVANTPEPVMAISTQDAPDAITERPIQGAEVAVRPTGLDIRPTEVETRQNGVAMKPTEATMRPTGVAARPARQKSDEVQPMSAPVPTSLSMPPLLPFVSLAASEESDRVSEELTTDSSPVSDKADDALSMQEQTDNAQTLNVNESTENHAPSEESERMSQELTLTSASVSVAVAEDAISLQEHSDAVPTFNVKESSEDHPPSEECKRMSKELTPTSASVSVAEDTISLQEHSDAALTFNVNELTEDHPPSDESEKLSKKLTPPPASLTDDTEDVLSMQEQSDDFIVHCSLATGKENVNTCQTVIDVDKSNEYQATLPNLAVDVVFEADGHPDSSEAEYGPVTTSSNVAIYSASYESNYASHATEQSVSEADMNVETSPPVDTMTTEELIMPEYIAGSEGP